MLLTNTSGVRCRLSKSLWTDVSLTMSVAIGSTVQLGAVDWMIDLVSSRAPTLRPEMTMVSAPARANCMAIALSRMRTIRILVKMTMTQMEALNSASKDRKLQQERM